MNINLINLKEKGSYKNIKEQVQFSDLTFRHQVVETPEPFILDLNIYNTKDSFVIIGDLKGKIILECSRCLEKFPYLFDVKLEDELVKEEIEDLTNIDITDLLIENILLSIPIKPLCSEDCKGLCPICGQNLNHGKCDCNTEIIDPRLAKLKEFFREDN